ncbi:O-antigen ligase-related protein [Rhodopirellula maiorica SM1]|uniref:O-antigen ligase-related protein n=1 Tax=Rhodopirellula maiorica SM1 TaxID=1265738 RepID=M5RDV3_9BACT|nr:O-antigen ligase family protein [Rhodopirellula maiorica]EMI17653.1 O-antigen ligase-related protein [Rhodopirellula maiorica SM1]
MSTGLASHRVFVATGPPPIERNAAVPRCSKAENAALWIGIGVALLWLTTGIVGFKAALAVITFCGFLMAMAGLRHPLIGVLGVSAICSIDALSRVFLMTTGVLRYNTFNYWLVLVILLTIPLQLRQKDPHTRLLQFFVFILFAGLILTPGLKDGILHLLNLVSVFGLLAYFYRCRNYTHIWYVLGISIGMLSALGGLAFFFMQNDLSFVEARAEYVEKDIIDRNYIDPNALTYFFLTGIFATCFAIAGKSKEGRARTTLLVLFSVNCCWVFLVGSRGGILVASACILFVLSSVRSNTKRFKFIVVGVLAIVVVINAFPNLRDRSTGRIEKLFDDQYTAAERTSSRSDFAIGAWRMFLENPLGIGTGGFKRGWANLKNTDGLGKRKLGVEKAAHSAWLKTLAENGVPGIIVFTAFVFSFAYIGWEHRRRGDLPLGLLVTITLSSAFTSTQFQSKGIWFIVAAAIVFLHHRPRITQRMTASLRSGTQRVNTPPLQTNYNG